MSEAQDGPQVVGMDLHRRRSVLVRMTADGRKLETVRLTNSPAELLRVIARAGKRPKVVLAATCGGRWRRRSSMCPPSTPLRQSKQDILARQSLCPLPCPSTARCRIGGGPKGIATVRMAVGVGGCRGALS